MTDISKQRDNLLHIANTSVHRYLTSLISILEYRQLAAQRALTLCIDTDERKYADEIVADCNRRINEILLINQTIQP